MPEGAIRSRASEPLERQVELFKRRLTAFVATALVPFAAKVSVVPCRSVRFGTAEHEQAEQFSSYPPSMTSTVDYDST